MPDYIIAAASTADLPYSYFTENNIPVIRYPYSIGTDVFEDDCLEESRQKAYEDMRKGIIYATSMINEETYYQFFRGLLETGKNVLYLDMTKEISSSYRACQNAAARIQPEFPQQTLYVMDTRCVSGGLGLLVMESVRRMQEGMSFDAVIEWGESHKLQIMHRFTVDDLSYLKRGGRVSNASAMIGAMLSIKPVLYIPDDGKLIAAAKVRGKRAALNALLEGVKRDMQHPDNQTVIINHADAQADAQWLKEELLRTFPTIGDVQIISLGIVIGAHCGPGLLAVFYFGDTRKP